MSRAILIRKLVPDQAEGVLRSISLEQWARAVSPQVRLSPVARAGDGQTPDIRFSLHPPHSGHEQYWL
eukprot:9242138-Lingulodinium_polyedra.AAC.1